MKTALREGSYTMQVDDEMASWLHLVDPNYCQPFGDIPRTNNSVQISRDMLAHRLHDHQSYQVSSGSELVDVHKQRAESSSAALTLAAGRAAGILPQVGYEAFNKPRTVSQPATKKWIPQQQQSSEVYSKETMGPPKPAVNFPQFAVGMSKVKARENKGSSKQQDTEMESSRSTLDCRSINSMQHPWSTNTNTTTQSEDMSLADSERNWSHDNGKYDDRGIVLKNNMEQQRTSQATFETFTSSSGGSGNSGDKAAKETHPSGLKRKEREVEDTANCQVKHSGSVPVETRKGSGRGTISKRTRAAEVHNLSERRRRDRINERMKALQELIPNSSKTDKASMLDEAIEYLKMLQFQLQMMSMRSGLSMSPMIVPTGMSPIQMQHHMGMGMGMGMGMRWMLPPGAPLANAPPHFPQGMNMEMYNNFMLQQQQEQQQQQQQQQPQHQQYEH